MTKRHLIPVILLALALLLAACRPAASTPQAMPAPAMMEEEDGGEIEAHPTEAMMEETEEMMDSGTPEAMMEDKTDEMMEPQAEDGGMDGEAMIAETGEGESAMMAPEWFSIALTDVRSGEAFTLADLNGKVVLVETMAQWCSNCLQQQRQVLQLHQALGERDDFISLGLDIDPNEDAATLKEYTERHGFTWRYAVAPAELSRTLSNELGAQFLNPPSTPMLIIDRHGEVHPLPFGIKSAEDLQAALEPFLQEAM